ncbi:transposase [Streptomyces cyaneofuscatus]|uniref:transposase n=1 Tax=Streptomyces cyaneofuscatus TaxID=66883 RepID=UPI003CE936EB
MGPEHGVAVRARRALAGHDRRDAAAAEQARPLQALPATPLVRRVHECTRPPPRDHRTGLPRRIRLRPRLPRGLPTQGRHPSTLSEEEHQHLKTILARCPELQATHQHIRDFGEILTCHLGALLPDWIDTVVRDDLPGLTGYARSMNNDFDAVTAGLTLSWSSGGTEGAVNRIKKVKRQLYGRAEFELLRKLILLQ